MKTDYLDILLLHRPDPLVEPEEVAEAFETLNSTGKVRCFGVSNHNAMQIELLRKYLKQPLIANQIHISLDHTSIIDEGIYVNNDNAPDYVRSEGTIEYCRIHNITIQAWAPLAGGSLTGDNVDEKYKDMAALIARYAEEKGVSREAIVTAWLLRHPAGIQPIIGTRTPERIKAACQADSIELSRVEWYKLYTAVSHRRLP